jgi:hypothetical protein
MTCELMHIVGIDGHDISSDRDDLHVAVGT